MGRAGQGRAGRVWGRKGRNNKSLVIKQVYAPNYKTQIIRLINSHNFQQCRKMHEAVSADH